MSRIGSLLVLPAYLAVTLILTWPLARDFGHAVPRGSDPVDPLMQAFIVGWDQHALAHRPLKVFDAPNFHPEPRTLTYMDDLLGEAVVSAPVAAWTGSLAAAYNALVLLAFVASAWALYRLARSLGASRPAGFLAGLLFAFGPIRLANLGNLNQLQTQFLPFGLMHGVRFAERGRGRHLALATGSLVAQSYFGWYGAFQLVIVFGLVALFVPRLRRPASPRRWRPTVIAAVLAGLAMLPGALPYWQQRWSVPGFGRTLGAAALYSADLLDYFRLASHSLAARVLPAIAGPHAFWPGLAALGLTLVGLGVWRRRRSEPGARAAADNLLIALGITAAGLSLGPLLHVAGTRLPIPLPYAVLYLLIPGFASMRAPERFSVLVLLVVAVVAALGFDALRRRLAPHGGWRAACVFVALGLIVVLEAWSAPITMVDLPDLRSLPPVYAWIARQPVRGALLEVPMPAGEAQESERDARRQLYSLAHGWPRADGVSGFSSPAHERFRRIMQGFPDAASLAAARGRDVRFIVVRTGEMPAGEARRMLRDVAGRPGIGKVARFDSDVVLRLEPSVSGARLEEGDSPGGVRAQPR